MSEWVIPNDVHCLRLRDIKQLTEDQSLLHGLWEASPVAVSLSDRIRDDVNTQRKTIDSISSLLDSIESHKEKISDLVKAEGLAAGKWASVEADMHRKIEPYSRVGISKSIQKDLQDSKSVSEACETKLLDLDSEVESPVIIAKRYVQAKQQMLYYQKLLETL